jgi:hypothetical protein
MAPCGMSMNNVFACMKDSQTYQNITFFRFPETWGIRENRVDVFAKRDLVRHTILATKNYETRLTVNAGRQIKVHRFFVQQAP